jgi:hypothetical protein
MALRQRGHSLVVPAVAPRRAVMPPGVMARVMPRVVRLRDGDWGERPDHQDACRYGHSDTCKAPSPGPDPYVHAPSLGRNWIVD